jgi:hypothetical protein
MPREARGCDMHCEGIWIGSESFIFVVETVQFVPGFMGAFDFPI